MSRYRICAMGNSHLATVKLGWDRVKDDYPDHSVVFFGFPPNTSTEFDQHVVVENGRLLPKTAKLRDGFALTSGGLTEIDGADYSAFVTFGLGIAGAQRCRQLYAGYRTPDFAAPGTHLISRSFLDAYVRERCSARAAVEPFEALHAISDAPVFLHAVPTPMTEIVTAKQYRGDAHCIPDIYRHLNPVFDRICEEVGRPDLYHYIPQPEETLDPSGLTKPDYIRMGVGFAGFNGHVKTNDYAHGNGLYGETVVLGMIRAFERVGLRERVRA